MRSARLAEWVLGFFAPPEQATCFVGDLIEESRGNLWLWWAVSRLAGRMFVHSLLDQPGRLLWLSLKGNLLMLAMSAVVGFGMFVAFEAARILQRNSTALSSTLLWEGAVFVALSYCHFAVGRWLARRSPGSEIAAVAAFWATGTVLTIAVWLAVAPFLHVPGGGEFSFPLKDVYFLALAAAGATFQRVRSSHRAVGSHTG